MDKKISELETLATVEDNDFVAVVDVSEPDPNLATKKASKSSFKGDKGDTATVSVGTVTTGAAGSNASVVNSGTDTDAILDFTIPRGNTGATGATGAAGEDAFVYIAYADDASGTGFTNTFNASKDYIAVKSTDTEIVSPQASDFTGLWKNYKGAQGIQGIQGVQGDNAYVYIAYASDDQGTDFTNVFDETLDYIAIKSTFTEIPTPQASDFSGLWKNYKGLQGIQGIQGTQGLVWKGEYENTTNYIVDDAVSYQGSAYICIQDTIGNIPTSALYWELLASKGSDGEMSNSGSAELNHIPEYVNTDGNTVADSGYTTEFFSDTKEPTGFLNTTDSTVSFNDGTLTLTITPAVDEYVYYIKGVKHTITTEKSVAITDTEGTHFFYLDSNEDLVTTTTFSSAILQDNAYVSFIYWDATNNKAIVVGEERHGCMMDGKTHEYLHNTRGSQLQSGGSLTNILADEDGSLDSHAQFGNETTILWDEDIKNTLSARISTETVYLYYRTGSNSSNIWREDDNLSFGVITTGTGRAAYNQLNVSTWQLTEVTNNNFVLAHAFAFNDTTRKFGVIIGQNEYSSIADARQGATEEINSLVLSGLPFQEFKFLGTIIYQTSNSYANTVKSIIRTTDSGDPYIDLRASAFTQGGSSATVVDHGALAGLTDDDHPQYLLTDGSRALTGDISTGGNFITDLPDPVNGNDAANKDYVDANGGTDWKDTGETWEPVVASFDDPIYRFRTTGDKTGKYSNGMKIRMVQTSGNNATALDLESSSSQYARNTSSTILSDNVTNATIEAWFKLESLPSSGSYMPVMDIITSPNGSAGYTGVIRINNNSGVLQLVAGFVGTGSFSTNNFPFQTGVWYHAATVKSGSTLTSYINGVALPSTGTSGSTNNFGAESNGLSVGVNRSTNLFFDGVISEVRVWETARTQSEIAGSMNKNLVGNETNLRAYYKLDNNYTDATGNGFTLTSSGSPSFTSTVPPKLTNGTKYGFIHAVSYDGSTYTNFDVYMGTDYGMNENSITSPFFSTHKSPYAFPLEKSKWQYMLIYDTTNNVQASATINVWYNGGGTNLSGSVHIGDWIIGEQIIAAGTRTQTTTAVTAPEVHITLSTANNSESNPLFTISTGSIVMTGLTSASYSGINNMSINTNIPSTLSATSKTTHYLNVRGVNSGTLTNFGFRGDILPTRVLLTCAHL